MTVDVAVHSPEVFLHITAGSRQCVVVNMGDIHAQNQLKMLQACVGVDSYNIEVAHVQVSRQDCVHWKHF